MKYTWVTPEMFSEKLEELVDAMGADAILQVPGVYDILAEHLNNEVLDGLVEDAGIMHLEKVRGGTQCGVEMEPLSTDIENVDWVDCLQQHAIICAVNLVRSLDRGACAALLEGVSIHVRDANNIATLREAVIANIEDGTIDPESIEDLNN